MENEELHVLGVESDVLGSIHTFWRAPKIDAMRPQKTIGFLSCHYTADCGGSIGYCTVAEDRPHLHIHPSQSTRSMPLASPRRRSNDVVHTKE